MKEIKCIDNKIATIGSRIAISCFTTSNVIIGTVVDIQDDFIMIVDSDENKIITLKDTIMLVTLLDK